MVPAGADEHGQGQVDRVPAVVHEQRAPLLVDHVHPGRLRVEPLGEHVVRGQGQDEHQQQVPGPASVRERVGPHQHRREEVARRQHVHVHDDVEERVLVGHFEQGRAVEQPEPADVEHGGDAWFGQDAQRPAAEHPGESTGGTHRHGAEREGDGRAEHQQQRCEHADEHVTGHVGRPAGVGGRSQRSRDGGGREQAAGRPGHRAPDRPRPAAPTDADDEQCVREQGQQPDDPPEHPEEVGAGGVVPGHAAVDRGPRERVSTIPTTTRTAATTFQTRSYGSRSTP